MTPKHFCLSGLILLLATLAGCSRPASSKAEPAHDVDYYTCTMHPSVHSKDPGKCPICGMELVPVMKKDAAAQSSAPAEAESETTEFTLPMARRQQIGVTYATVEERSLSRAIRTVGFIVPDQRRSWSYVARVEGYVQQLFVTSPGETVDKGAPLLSIYSPDLLTAERELTALLAARQAGKGNDTADRLIDAAKLRLRQWNVTDEQIAELERGGKPSETLTLRSPFRGLVAKVAASQGASVKGGDTLVEIVDLSKVWVWVDFYETEIAALHPGQKVAVTSVSYPGRTFDGAVAVVDPFVDSTKRTARVRIDIENPDLLLRPGMYVNAVTQSDPITALAIPVDAVLPTGLRHLVFLDKGGGRLEPKFITLSGKFGDFYAVQQGLAAGDRIVSSANFLIDAESKLQGALKDFSAGDDQGTLPHSADLAPLVQSYLTLHDLLARDSFDGVPKLADEMRQEASTLGDTAQAQALQQAIKEFKPADLAQARVAFGRLSAALLEVLKEVPAPRALYVMRCPMWNGSPSEWVQVTKEIENPFMGQAMETCGETVRTLGK